MQHIGSFTPLVKLKMPVNVVINGNRGNQWRIKSHEILVKIVGVASH